MKRLNVILHIIMLLCLSSFTSATLYEDINNSILAYWTFDMNISDFQPTGKPHNLKMSLYSTLGSPAFNTTEHLIGNASFQGTGEGHLINGTKFFIDYWTNYTINFWFKTNQSTITQTPFHEDNQYGVFRLNFNTNGSIQYQQKLHTTVWENLFNKSNYCMGGWCMVTMQWDNKTIYLYLNNTLQSTQSCGSIGGHPNFFSLGGTAAGSNNIVGQLDDVMIIGKNITDEERNYLWNEGIGRLLTRIIPTYSESYNLIGIFGSTSTFYLNISYNHIYITNATLYYNNTPYYPSVDNFSEDNYSVDVVTPVSFHNINYANISSNWVLELSNGDSYNTTTVNQTIYKFILDNCSNATDVTLSFHTYYEDLISTSLNTTMEIEGTYYFQDYSLLRPINVSFSNSEIQELCIFPTNESLNVDLYVRYTTVGGFTHRYYIRNMSLNSSILNVSLYNFNTTTGISDLKITTRYDSTYYYFPNVYTKLQRKYSDEGVWRVVQMDKSGDFGTILFNIKEQNVDYRLLFADGSNHILKTTESMKFVCDSGVCELTVLLDPYTSASTENNITINTSYRSDENIIEVNWSDPTSYSSNVKTLVTKETITGTTTICDVSQDGSAGNTACNISGYNGMILLKVHSTRNSVEMPEVTKWIEVNSTSLGNVIGEREGAFWSFGFSVTVVMAGVLMGATGGIVSLLFALIAMYYLGLINALSITFIIVAGIMGIVIGLRVKS